MFSSHLYHLLSSCQVTVLSLLSDIIKCDEPTASSQYARLEILKNSLFFTKYLAPKD